MHKPCIHAFIKKCPLQMVFKELRDIFCKHHRYHGSKEKYTFKNSSAKELKELATLVPNLDNFKNRYGKLISILKTKVEKGILETLVQFYDPVYHCFTFPNYQLMPTLEEYSYWIGLPVTNDIPFSGLEKEPKVDDIAELLQWKISNVKANMTKKGGIWGLTSKFLIGKASMLASKGSMIAFETFLALLIYGFDTLSQQIG